MHRKIYVLTAMTAAVIALGGVLWAVSVPVWLGIADAAAALGLLAALTAEGRRYAERIREEGRSALEAREAEYKRLAEQEAARARAEMDAFRSGLSHSLRMPVAIIQGYAELLTSGVVTDPSVVSEYLEKISLRSQYLTEAISRQFSSAETLDSSRLAYTELDLLSLVRQAAADMQTAATDQGVAIQVVSSETQIPAKADAHLLNRVLFNLMENALKYMGRPGSVTIRVLRDGENASIRVQDDGLGLPEEEAARIFESNYQGSNRTRGQGYGLYLVKRAIECHGGSVAAQSAPGRGMGITLTLPLCPPQESC